MINETVRVYFKFLDLPISDPEWNFPRKFIPNVGDELYLVNVREDPYQHYWYRVAKRRWLAHNIVEIRFTDRRWKVED